MPSRVVIPPPHNGKINHYQVSPGVGSPPPHNGKVFALRRPDTQQRKSQLLLVHLYFFISQFHIKIARFSFVFPTYVQFCTKIVVLFFPFQLPTFLARLENSSHMKASACPLFSKSITIDQPQRLAKDSISAKQSLNSRIIFELLSYCSIGLRSNRNNNIFIIE